MGIAFAYRHQGFCSIMHNSGISLLTLLILTSKTHTLTLRFAFSCCFHQTVHEDAKNILKSWQLNQIPKKQACHAIPSHPKHVIPNREWYFLGFLYLPLPLGSFEAAQLHFFLMGGEGWGGWWGGSNPSPLAEVRASPIQLSSCQGEFGCLTGKHACSDAQGAHPGVNSPGKRFICFLCCVCLAPEISYQKQFLCWGRREMRKGGEGGK